MLQAKGRRNNMNKATFTGRLTNDPTIYGNDDPKKQAAHFFLAVKKLGKNQEDQASFIPCVVFGKRGDYLHKGSLIGISGWISTERITKEDGSVSYPWEVVVQELDFLESKKTTENQNGNDPYSNNNYNENPYANPYNEGNQAFNGNDEFNRGM